MPASAGGRRVGGVRAGASGSAITGRWWPIAAASWRMRRSYYFAKHFAAPAFAPGVRRGPPDAGLLAPLKHGRARRGSRTGARRTRGARSWGGWRARAADGERRAAARRPGRPAGRRPRSSGRRRRPCCGAAAAPGVGGGPVDLQQTPRGGVPGEVSSRRRDRVEVARRGPPVGHQERSALSAVCARPTGRSRRRSSGSSSLSELPGAHRQGTRWAAASNGTSPKPSRTEGRRRRRSGRTASRFSALADRAEVEDASGEHRVGWSGSLASCGREEPCATAGPANTSTRVGSLLARARRAAAARTAGSCAGSPCPDRAGTGATRAIRRRRAEIRVMLAACGWSTPRWTTSACARSTRSSASASSRAWAEKNSARSAVASAVRVSSRYSCQAWRVGK